MAVRGSTSDSAVTSQRLLLPSSSPESAEIQLRILRWKQTACVSIPTQTQTHVCEAIVIYRCVCPWHNGFPQLAYFLEQKKKNNHGMLTRARWKKVGQSRSSGMEKQFKKNGFQSIFRHVRAIEEHECSASQHCRLLTAKWAKHANL